MQKTVDKISNEEYYRQAIMNYEDLLSYKPKNTIYYSEINNAKETISNLNGYKLIKKAISFSNKKQYDKAISLAKEGANYFDHYTWMSGINWTRFFTT